MKTTHPPGGELPPPPKTSENRLVESVSPDTLSAELEQTLHRYRVRVRQAAYRHGITDADLDELLQEVRIRLWKAQERGEKLSELPASYLYKTAMSASVDLLRRRRTAREEASVSLEGIRQAGIEPVGREDASQAAESDELGAQIDGALGTLTPSRQPVVRMYLAGYDRSEIASLMKWTEAKTRNLLYRGLEELREELRRRGLAPHSEGTT